MPVTSSFVSKEKRKKTEKKQKEKRPYCLRADIVCKSDDLIYILCSYYLERWIVFLCR